MGSVQWGVAAGGDAHGEWPALLDRILKGAYMLIYREKESSKHCPSCTIRSANVELVWEEPSDPVPLLSSPRYRSPQGYVLIPRQRRHSGLPWLLYWRGGDCPFHQCYLDKIKHRSTQQAATTSLYQGMLSPCTEGQPLVENEEVAWRVWTGNPWRGDRVVAAHLPSHRQEWHGHAHTCAETVGCVALDSQNFQALDLPPALTILHIGQFLNEDMRDVGGTSRTGWRCTLCSPVGHWGCRREVLDADGERLHSKVSLMVEAFVSVLNVEIPPPTASAVSCWDSPQVCIPHQRDEGPLAHVILYLDEGATHQPTLSHGSCCLAPTLVHSPNT